MEFVGVVLAVNLTCAVIAAWLAHHWGRDSFSWVLICAILGPFGLVALVALRPDTRATPVVRVDGDGAGAGPRVLVPVDGSEFGLVAARHVVEAFGQSLGEIVLLAVLPLERADALRESAGSLARRQLDEDVATHVKGAEEVIRGTGIPYKTEVRFGNPGSEIVSAAREGGYDLIVMGRRGRGGAKKLLLGSVSEKVVKDAGCPVTVVG